MVVTIAGNLEDKINALFKLAESSWIEFNERRAYEWKINFALWPGLGIVSGFAINEKDILFPHWAVLGGILILIVCYAWWQYGLYNSNFHDQQKRNHYLEEIRNIIGSTLPDHLRRSPGKACKCFWFHWSHTTQIIITTMFLILTGYVLTRH